MAWGYQVLHKLMCVVSSYKTINYHTVCIIPSICMYMYMYTFLVCVLEPDLDVWFVPISQTNLYVYVFVEGVFWNLTWTFGLFRSLGLICMCMFLLKVCFGT